MEIPFKDHTVLCTELVDWVCAKNNPGTFAFDSYFTNAASLNHIHGKEFGDEPRGYVGSLKFNRNLEYTGGIVKAADLAATIDPAARKSLRVGDLNQWYVTCTLHIPDVHHKVRIVVLWRKPHASDPAIILVTNRIHWDASRIVRAYRHRWTGTETVHRDGKQELGMGDCQVRDSEGQTRHLYLVMVAYSPLVLQRRHGRADEWAYQTLTTIGEACRAVFRETVRDTLDWAMDRAANPFWTRDRVLAELGLGGGGT